MPHFKHFKCHLISAFPALKTAVLFALLELSPEAETDGVMGGQAGGRAHNSEAKRGVSACCGSISNKILALFVHPKIVVAIRLHCLFSPLNWTRDRFVYPENSLGSTLSFGGKEQAKINTGRRTVDTRLMSQRQCPKFTRNNAARRFGPRRPPRPIIPVDPSSADTFQSCHFRERSRLFQDYLKFLL